MQTSRCAESKASYWVASMALFSFFLTWSFAYSLFPLWLNQTVLLSGAQTGVVFAANALAALFVMPLYGFIQDKLGVKKYLLFAIAAMMLCVGPFFQFVYLPLLTHQFYVGAALGALYGATAFGAAVGALEAYAERTSRMQGFEFGKVRMWGSLGWAIATFFAGRLFNINPLLTMWLASLCALFFLCCVWRLSIATPQPQAQATATISLYDALELFRMRQFWRFTVFVMGVSCLYQIYDQQFPIYFASFFSSVAEGNEYFGYLNSVQVFLEAGMMFVAPFIVNRIGAKNGLLLSGVIMALRIISSGFADSSTTISVIKLLHALELPIMLVSVFKYIVAHFDARLSATLYLIGFHVFTQLMATVLSSPVGAMYDALGFSDAYLVLGVVVLVCLLMSAMLLQSDKGSRSVQLE